MASQLAQLGPRYDQLCQAESGKSGKRPKGFRPRGQQPRPTAKTRKAKASEAKFDSKRSKRSRRSRRSSEALINRIYELLSFLTREVRREVIDKDFSHQQRLLLEQWIVSRTNHRKPLQKPSLQIPQGSEAVDRVDRKGSDEAPVTLGLCDESEAKSTAAGLNDPQRAILERETKRRRQKSSISGLISWTGKTGTTYRAYVVFACLFIESKQCDLAAALDILVLLTATKNHFGTSELQSESGFGERVQEALDSNAREYGQSLADMGLRFRILLRHCYFLGSKQMFTPKFRSILELGKEYDKLKRMKMINRKRGNPLFTLGPVDLAKQWSDFLPAWGDLYAAAGWDRQESIARLSEIYKSNARYQEKATQRWELVQMAQADHRSKRKSRLGRTAVDLVRERKRMCREDLVSRRFRKQQKQFLSTEPQLYLALLVQLLWAWDQTQFVWFSPGF